MLKDRGTIFDKEPETPAQEEIDETGEFSTAEGLDASAGNLWMFIKSGQEIHNKQPGRVVELEDQAVVPPARPSGKVLPLQRSVTWWSELKQRIRSVFVKPKRDAFIASFFNDDDYDQSHYA